MTCIKFLQLLLALWFVSVGQAFVTASAQPPPQPNVLDRPWTLTQTRGVRVSIEEADKILRERTGEKTPQITLAIKPVAPSAAKLAIGPASPGCSAASPSLPIEIATLAASLKCDPDLIFEYVYNNIEYEPLFGSNKGALGTLLDQRGNDIDQAQLLLALLSAAGFSTSQLEYQYGYIRLNGTQVSGWLGVKNDAFAMLQLLADGGVPFQPGWIYNSDGTLQQADIAHVWVRVQINSTWYVLDPSFKLHSVSNGLANLGAILGYNQSNFLTDAGGTSDSISVSNIGRAAIRSDLVAYSNNLISYIKQHNSAWSVSDVIGGKTILYLTGSPLRQTVLPYLSPDQPSGFPQDWGSSVPNAYRTCFTISMPGVTGTPCSSASSQTIKLYADETYGKRITVFSVPSGSNFIPTLLIDGSLPPNGQNTGTANPPWTVNVQITHPFAGVTQCTGVNQCYGLTINPGGSYLISAGWGQVGRGMVEKHRKLLAQALAVPNADSASEQVLGETLAVIGYGWLAQFAIQQRLGDQLAKVTTLYHHGVGITGQSLIQGQSNTSGPYVDLPLNIVAFALQTCWPNLGCPSAPPTSAFFSLAEMLSSLESAVLEQTQAPTQNMTAASTVKLIDLNVSTATNKTFFADATTSVAGYFNLIRPNLVGYAGADLHAIDCLISTDCTATGGPTGQQVVLPANGNIQVGVWHGAGYTVINPATHSISQRISGGMSGGFAGVNISDQVVNDNTLITVTPPPAASELLLILNPQTSSANPKINDPVDTIAGANVYNQVDLVIGSGAFPYALPFQRTYRSSSNTLDVGLGKGWTHNYSYSVTPNSDPYKGMGEGVPISAAAAIAALFVSQDILSGAITAKTLTVAGVVTRWLTDQLTNNAVIVATPDSSEEFIWLPYPDGATTISYSPPLGSAATLTRTGTTYTYTAKDGTVLTFGATTAGSLASSISNWTHPNGMSVAFSYDGSGKLTTVANNLGRTLTLGYTGTHVSTVTDNTGRAVAFSYDASNNLISTSDPLQAVTRFAYSSLSQLTQVFYPANPLNAYVTNVYDALGRVSQQFNADGNSSSFYFAGSRSEIIDQAGNRQITYQSPRGKVLKDFRVLNPATGAVFYDTAQSNGNINVVANQYDGQDRLVLSIAPEGNRVAYTYDANSNVLTTTAIAKAGSPLADLVTTYTYDATFNKPTSIIDPLGLVTTMSYDPTTGNLLTAVADIGSAPHFNARTSFTYNNRGQVLTAIDPLGTVTQSTYDSLGNQISVTRDAGSNGLNQTTTMAYSAVGDVVSVTNPNGKVTTNSYDAARRLTTTVSPGTPGFPNGVVTALSYDADGRVVQMQQSANGAALRTVSSTYTPTGKVATTTDANGNVTRYAYDVLDRLASVTDALGRATSYSYDALSRRTAVFNTAIQAGALLQQAYTPNGVLASLTNAVSNATSFAYDGFDRLVTTTYPGSSTETFTYDADGNVLTRKTRANATIAFGYDTLNRLISKTPPSPAPVVSYRYDLNGRLLGVSDTGAAIAPALPPSGTAVQYATTTGYDALNRPTGISWSPAPTAATPTASSVTFNHSYNRANQRSGQTTTDNTWWDYPAASPSTVSYTANALDQYVAVAAVTPSYDANGNLTFDGSFTYGYDAENRLISATGPGLTASYAYDAQGRRKSKTVNGVTTVFVTDADNREVLEYDGGSGQILRWYAYGLGANDALSQLNVAAATRATFIPDLQGSIVATQDSTTGALTKLGYSSYGVSASTAGSFRYTGQRIDPETAGLHYYRARMYSPVLGRFMQADPIGYSAGTNLYAYVGNDPLNLIDPFGSVATTSQDYIAPSLLQTNIGSSSRNPTAAETINQTSETVHLASMSWQERQKVLFGRRQLELFEGGGGLGPPQLPQYVRGGPTAGVLQTPVTADIPLVSGVGGPASALARGTPGFNIVTKTHVEGHAVALMRQQGITQGTLFINNPAICGPCMSLLPRMLPPGSTLNVVLPNGTTIPFRGIVP